MEAIEIVDSTALEFDEFGSMKLFDLARALFLKLLDSDQLTPRRNQVVIGHRKPVLINSLFAETQLLWDLLNSCPSCLIDF